MATREGQGRHGDFSFTVDGELVHLGLVCDRDREDLVLALGSTMHQAGWHTDELSSDFRTAVEEDVDELLRFAAEWPVGTVLERRLDDTQPRTFS